MKLLTSPVQVGNLILKNRLVMPPMATSKAENGKVTPDLIRYYQEKSDGGALGLIIMEHSFISAEGQASANQTSVSSDKDLAGLRELTAAIHANGSPVFAQLNHAGSAAKEEVTGYVPLAPSALKHPKAKDDRLPKAMTAQDLEKVIADFKEAARRAQAAGFDGVEIMAANGFIFDQFLSSELNTRTDEYGGSVENRQRFLLETIDAVAEAVGNSHVAVRLSPFGRIYDLAPYEGEEQTWSAITDALGQRELAYVHLYYQPVYTKAPLPEGFRRRFRNTFKGTIIAAGGFTRDIAEQALEDDELDLVAFGVPYIANPDLVERMQNGWPLAESDRATYYGVSGSPEKGYTDYPVWQAQ